MKKYLVFFLVLLTVNEFSFGQESAVNGKSFDFSSDVEKEAQVFLIDGYNYYLFSITNEQYGLGGKSITVRKFDQSNSMTDKFTKDFAISNDMLHNFGGMYEVGDNKVVTFIQSYSKKTLKSDVYMYVFDKSTNSFSTKIVDSYPFLSISKSGLISSSMSNNGRYISLVHVRNKAKKESEVVDVTLFNTETMEPVFSVSNSYEDNYLTGDNITTNSGRTILVRNPNSYKDTKYVAVVDANGSSSKLFDEKVQIHKPVAVSINNQDYLFAFNFTDKSVRVGNDFESILFYDVNQGKTLFNNKINGNKGVDGIKKVNFIQTLVNQNNIFVFADVNREESPKVKDPRTGMVGVAGMRENFYGPGSFYEFSLGGELINEFGLSKSIKTDFSQSFGVLNVQGIYYINATSGTFKMDPFKELKLEEWWLDRLRHNQNVANPRRVQKLFYFNPANNKFITAYTHNGNKMCFMTFSNE